MARGVKTPIAEKIAKINEQITAAETSLKTLREQKKALEKELKSQQIAELSDIVESSGLSVDELKKIVAEKQKKASK